MSNLGDRYENSIRVISAFFSALIGFSLKNLLDLAKADKTAAADWWSALILAVLLFLRFLLGSANHLSLVHVKARPTESTRYHLIFDLFFLVLFGLVALRMCYSENLLDFFIYNAVYLVFAVVWGVVA